MGFDTVEETNTVEAWATIVEQLFEYGDSSGDTDYYELADRIDGEIDGRARDEAVIVSLTDAELVRFAIATS